MPTITQAGVVTSSLVNVAASSYSFVAGSTTHHSASALHTINITTHAIGNLLVSVPFTAGAIASYTAPSGANTGTWTDCGEGSIGTAAAGNVTLWSSKVTAVGATTITVPYGGAVTQSTLNILEFTCPGVDVGTAWTVDAHGSSILAAATLAPNYPSLAPSAGSALPEIYVGNMGNFTSGFISAGSTPGFTYLGSGSADQTIEVYNTNVLAPTAAAATGSSADTTGYPTIAALFKATIAHALFDNLTLTLQPVPTGRMWIISQIGFEFLPSNTLTTMTVNILLNGRVIKPGINPNAGQFQGPPYITVRAGDTMVVNFIGVPVGASAVANFLYNEYSAYATTHDLGGVV